MFAHKCISVSFEEFHTCDAVPCPLFVEICWVRVNFNKIKATLSVEYLIFYPLLCI